jgi:hypothetical protein
MASNMKGGGYGSAQHREIGNRTGDTRKGISPGWAGQKGQLQGNHITDDKNTGYTGEKKFDGKTGISVPLGNSVALNVGKGGVGTGRTLYGQSGSQGTHGSTNPGNPRLVPREHIISSFGPDYKGRS